MTSVVGIKREVLLVFDEIAQPNMLVRFKEAPCKPLESAFDFSHWDTRQERCKGEVFLPKPCDITGVA